MSIQQMSWDDLLDLLAIATEQARGPEYLDRLTAVEATRIYTHELARRVVEGGAA